MKKQRSRDQQWYPEVFRANLIAFQENVWHLMMNAICGANSSECFAKLTRDGSWQKMYQGCSQVKMEGFSDEFLGTWPKEGVMYGGIAFLPTLPEPRFGVSVSRLWPRPIASDGVAWTRIRKCNPRLTIADAWRRHKQDRPIYDYVWNGLSAAQAAELNGTMMGFPKHWTSLKPMETPSCPNSSTPSSGQ